MNFKCFLLSDTTDNLGRRCQFISFIFFYTLNVEHCTRLCWSILLLLSDPRFRIIFLIFEFIIMLNKTTVDFDFINKYVTMWTRWRMDFDPLGMTRWRKDVSPATVQGNGRNVILTERVSIDTIAMFKLNFCIRHIQISFDIWKSHY